MDYTYYFKQYLYEGNDWVKNCGLRWGGLTDSEVHLYADVKESNLSGIGFLHGGVIFTLADTTAGFLAHSQGEAYVTMDAKINFIKSATKGTLRCDASYIHKGKKTALIHTVVVDDEGILLMDGTFTMIRVDKVYKELEK
ncbi:MAG: PaaI family thioesterase [Tissierellia bacterium]|nr:PaaI family thioesterase [Tissierellia bacterium]